jgi:tRNA nucleotidyltransferase/poly(A) polymerase
VYSGEKMMYSISLHNWIDNRLKRPLALYLVGGTVRNLIMDSVPKDIDLVCKNAKDYATSIAKQKNTALVPMEKKPDEPCYRVVDREHADNFLDIAEMRGEDIYKDLQQRDFTINAVAIEVLENGTLGKTVDPLKGIQDIRNRVIRAVSEKVFVSDPLRILRAFRFAATLGFTIDHTTWKEMKRGISLVASVSAERITAELFFILRSSRSAMSFKMMDEIGLLEVLFPEILPMKSCNQNGYHHLNVWYHSLLVLENTEEIINNLIEIFGKWSTNITENLSMNDRLPLLKLAALLHDSGKPMAQGKNGKTGKITFHRHDEEGARIVDAIARRFKMSNYNRELQSLLVSEHLQVLNLMSKGTKATGSMRWFRKMKDDSIPAIILGMADVLSSQGADSSIQYREDFIEQAKQSINNYYAKTKAIMEKPNLINGYDLIALGMEPGPKIGHILDQVRHAQDTGVVTTREEALSLVKAKLYGN